MDGCERGGVVGVSSERACRDAATLPASLTSADSSFICPLRRNRSQEERKMHMSFLKFPYVPLLLLHAVC